MKRTPRVHAAAHPLLGSLLAFMAWACQDVSVQVVPVASVEVVPASVTLIVGENEELRAVVRDEGGTELSARPTKWFVRDVSVALVDPEGVLEGVAPGNTLVEARSEGVVGEAEVTILPRPSIELDPAESAFTAREGRQNPPPDTVSVENGGGGTLSDLNREISYAAGQQGGWLDARLTAPSAPALMILEADIAGLPQGQYEASVLVRSGQAENSPQDVTVTLVVDEPPPRIDLSSTDVSMVGKEGATEPAEVTVRVSNGGGETLTGLTIDGTNYPEGQPDDWLSAEFEDDDRVAPTRVVLRASSRELDPGDYSATVTISAPNASNSPVMIEVSFEVIP